MKTFFLSLGLILGSSMSIYGGRYSIALYPKKNYASFFTHIANSSFKESYVDYLLGSKSEFGRSVPHIALCQFEASQEQFNDLKTEFAKLKKCYYSPCFSRLAFTPCEANGFPGVCFFDLEVEREYDLVQLHDDYQNFLQEHKVKRLNIEDKERYRPHLTLAKIKTSQIMGFSLYASLLGRSEIFGRTSGAFTVVLGMNDKHGQFFMFGDESE